MATRKRQPQRDQQPGPRPRIDEDLGELGAGGGGSNDVTNRAGDAVNRGDVKRDRKKLFPDEKRGAKRK
jgi:hypothetical protein